MKELNEFRQQMDSINHDLVDVLVKRYSLVAEIATHKQTQQIDLKDEDREQQILSAVKKQTLNSNASKYILDNFDEVLKKSLEYMQSLKDSPNS